MTTNNLTLDNWKELKEMIAETFFEHIDRPYCKLHVDYWFPKFKSLFLSQHQKDIEQFRESTKALKSLMIDQFKNMESMKKEKIKYGRAGALPMDYTKDNPEKFNQCEAFHLGEKAGKNQKIDEITSELKRLERNERLSEVSKEVKTKFGKYIRKLGEE